MKKSSSNHLNQVYEWARKKMYSCNATGFPVGEFIKEKFIKPYRITEKQIADHMQIDLAEFQLLLEGKIQLDVPMARRLSKAFKTSVFFWLALQQHYDLYRDQTNVNSIKPLMLIRKAAAQKNSEVNQSRMTRNNRLLDIMEEFGIKKVDLANAIGKAAPLINYQFIIQQYDTELIEYVAGIYYLISGKVSLSFLIDGKGSKYQPERRVPKSIKKGTNRRILKAMANADVSLATMALACNKSSGGVWSALKGKTDSPKIIYFSKCVHLTKATYDYLLYAIEDNQ